MSYGLIVGDDRNIQFDTNRQPLEVWKHEYANSWTAVLSAGCGQGYRSGLSCSCLIAGVGVKPNTSTFVSRDAWYLYQSGTDTIEYFIGSPDSGSVPLPAWGLVTYDAAGNVIFNSNARYVKIRQIIDVNRSTLINGSSVDISHNGIENPYYIIPINWGVTAYHLGTGFGGCFKMIGVKKISATSAKIGWFVIYGTTAVSGSPPTSCFSVPDPFRVAVCTL